MILHVFSLIVHLGPAAGIFGNRGIQSVVVQNRFLDVMDSRPSFLQELGIRIHTVNRLDDLKLNVADKGSGNQKFEIAFYRLSIAFYVMGADLIVFQNRPWAPVQGIC